MTSVLLQNLWIDFLHFLARDVGSAGRSTATGCEVRSHAHSLRALAHECGSVLLSRGHTPPQQPVGLNLCPEIVQII